MGSSYLNPICRLRLADFYGLVCLMSVCVGLARRGTRLAILLTSKKTNHMASHWDLCPYSLSISQVQLDETTVSPKFMETRRTLEETQWYTPLRDDWVVFVDSLRFFLPGREGLEIYSDSAAIPRFTTAGWGHGVIFVAWPNVRWRNVRSFKFG